MTTEEEKAKALKILKLNASDESNTQKIKISYMRLFTIHHCKKNHAEEKLKELAEAYKLLTGNSAEEDAKFCDEDLDLIDPKNCLSTLLYFAIVSKKTDFLEKLLSKFNSGECEQYGDYVNINIGRYTPLYFAIFFIGEPCIETVKLLLKHGAKTEPKVPDILFQGQLLADVCAMKQSHVKIVELLIQHGVEINSESNYLPFHTTNALRNACLKGHTDIVKLLLENRADPNLLDPLSAACGHVDIIKLLLQYGADPKKSNNGQLMKDLDDSGNSMVFFMPYGYGNDVKKLLVQYGVIDKEYLMINTVLACSCLLIGLGTFCNMSSPWRYVSIGVVAPFALLFTCNALVAFIKPTLFPTKPSPEFVEVKVKSERVIGLEGDVPSG